jgi:hypothetical protein
MILTTSEHKPLVKSGMKQAFGMAEAALEAIGTLPDNNANAQWKFPDSESRHMAARIFGLDFDVEAPYEYNHPQELTKVNKYEVIRGTASPLSVHVLNLRDPRHILLPASLL